MLVNWSVCSCAAAVSFGLQQNGNFKQWDGCRANIERHYISSGRRPSTLLLLHLPPPSSPPLWTCSWPAGRHSALLKPGSCRGRSGDFLLPLTHTHTLCTSRRMKDKRICDGQISATISQLPSHGSCQDEKQFGLSLNWAGGRSH